jgi:2'-5' RNA ligase
MAQSVELLLDAAAEERIRAEWSLLAQAGLPSERRGVAAGPHRPHITLYAASQIPEDADQALPALVDGLDLHLQIGACLFFGSGRTGRFILVRQVPASRELLELQRRVTERCGGSAHGQFGPGRWTPHVTMARRMAAGQAASALELLGAADPVPTYITRCRRWDGTARADWLL